MKARTKMIGGEYWFSAAYAAKLLGTSRKLVEAMAVRELVRSQDATGDCFVSEADVTRLRRDLDEWKRMKQAAKLPPMPRQEKSMPAATIYAGENSVPGRTKGRIGNPLADQGHKRRD